MAKRQKANLLLLLFRYASDPKVMPHSMQYTQLSYSYGKIPYAVIRHM